MARISKAKADDSRNSGDIWPPDAARLPKHVAIIMDGNGRWAQARGMPRLFGHRSSMETVRNIVRASSDWGIQVLTLYAFSTENWTRPQEEVQGLMDLLVEFLERELETLFWENVKIRMMGDPTPLSPLVRRAIENAIRRTSDNTGLIFNLGLNYGGRQELLQAAAQMVREKLPPESLTQQELEKRLYTAGLPDPDFIIRTSGELRLSNFLLWQGAYAELYFCEEKWPDFTPDRYRAALESYMSRKRRFGNIEKSPLGGG